MVLGCHTSLQKVIAFQPFLRIFIVNLPPKAAFVAAFNVKLFFSPGFH
jgi:hypothetical protein